MSLQRAISRNADLRQVYISLDERLANLTHVVLGIMQILAESESVHNPKLNELSGYVANELNRIDNELKSY